MKNIVYFIFAIVIVMLSNFVQAAEVIGSKPNYLLFGASSVPNEKAMVTKIWAPGLDEGFVPQGVTWAENSVLIGSYHSTDPKIGKGQCRVYQVDIKSGSSKFFDLPSDCGHAGGLAYIGNDELLVSDTRKLYRVKLSLALNEKNTQNALIGSIKLGGAVKGSFAGWDGKMVWLGASEKDESMAKIFAFSKELIEQKTGTILRQEDALKTLSIGVQGQGVAFDKEGKMWLSFSSSKFGELQQVDINDGKVIAAYEMPIGIEDLAFDQEGGLWSVSEAGSQRWSKWSSQFPIVFRLDINKLTKK